MLILGHNVLGAAPGPFVAGFLSDTFRNAGWEQPMTYGNFFFTRENLKIRRLSNSIYSPLVVFALVQIRNLL